MNRKIRIDCFNSVISYFLFPVALVLPMTSPKNPAILRTILRATRAQVQVFMTVKLTFSIRFQQSMPCFRAFTMESYQLRNLKPTETLV